MPQSAFHIRRKRSRIRLAAAFGERPDFGTSAAHFERGVERDRRR